MPAEPLKVENIHDTWGLYSHAVKAGNLLFISGQVAIDPEGNIVGKGDIEAQTEQVMKNLKTIPEAAGASFRDVAKITVYMVNPEHRAKFHEVRKRYFGEHKPASVLVFVKSLVHPDLLVEVEAVAVLGKGK